LQGHGTVQQQARKAFELIDTHDKGCIVAQDLLQADLDGALDEEMVEEMMEEFVPDGEVLTENDIIRIARLVNRS
jgi:Ca2+-binding EF-hand superfamily protein